MRAAKAAYGPPGPHRLEAMTNQQSASPPIARPVALVTGASDRIGAAIATQLGARGLWCGHPLSLRRRGRQSACRRAFAQAGGAAAIVKADLAKRSQRASLIEKAGKPFGPLSVLVNNASVFEPDSARDLDEALWDQHFAIHAEAPVFLARDFAAQLPAGHRREYRQPRRRARAASDARPISAIRCPNPCSGPRPGPWRNRWLRPSASTPSAPAPSLPHTRQSQAEFDRSVDALPLKRNAGPEAIADGVLDAAEDTVDDRPDAGARRRRAS